MAALTATFVSFIAMATAFAAVFGTLRAATVACFAALVVALQFCPFPSALLLPQQAL